MKSIFQSKTVWLNTIMTVIGVLTLLQSQSLDSKTLGELVIAQGIANVILRVWFTTEPVQ